jgi:hypothetical protein
VNVILWDGDTETWQAGEGQTAEVIPDDSTVSVGWTYDGAKFVAPAA